LVRAGDWRELEARLAIAAGEPMVARPTADLAGLAEIAAVTGKPRTTIKSALSRAENGPRPLFSLAATPVWSAGELGDWLATRVISFGGRKPKPKPEAVMIGVAKATGTLTSIAPKAKLVESAPRPGQVFVP
jgi:hypothetical protein